MQHQLANKCYSTQRNPVKNLAHVLTAETHIFILQINSCLVFFFLTTFVSFQELLWLTLLYFSHFYSNFSISFLLNCV